MRKHARVLSVATLALLAAVPSPALAEKTFVGESEQQRRFSVRVGDDGLVNLVRTSWRVRRCREGGTYQDRTKFRPPFDASTVDAFRDSGTYNTPVRRGIRTRITVTLTGNRVVDPANPAIESWQGTFKALAVIRRKGRTIDRCTLRSIDWTARPSS